MIFDHARIFNFAVAEALHGNFHANLCIYVDQQATTTSNWPRRDEAYVPIGMVFLMKLDVPLCTSNSGRQFKIGEKSFLEINNISNNILYIMICKNIDP